MRSARAALMLVITSVFAASGQTTIDLSRQARNVDFSAAQSTRPLKAGSVLPSVCRTGEMLFRTDAPAGQNVYGCTADNIWSVQAVASDVPLSGGASAFSLSASVIELTIQPGTFRFGSTTATIEDEGHIFATGSASGMLWVYAVPSGAVVIAHDTGAGNIGVSGNKYVLNDAGNGFPQLSIPMFECIVSSGAFSGCADKRSALSSDPVVSGPSSTVNVDCSNGSPCTVDLETAVVPTLSGENVFTGRNLFSYLRLPMVTSLVAADCDEASETSHGVVLSTAPTGQRWHICEETSTGVFAWVKQGDGGGSGGDYTAGPSGAVAVNNETRSIDIVVELVPTKSGMNTFTGLNVFSQLKLPTVSSLVTADCDEASEKSKGVVLSSAPTGQRWHVCEETSTGVFAWVKQGDGGGSGGDYTAGPSGAVAVNNAARTIDIVAELVPTKGGTNTFTGLNAFSQLKLPTVSSLVTADCDEASEKSSGVVLSSAPTGQRWHVCEETSPGVFAWVKQGDGGGDYTAGPSGAVAVNNAARTIDIVAELVPTKSGMNTFTGLNVFSQLKLPTVSSLVAADCDEASEKSNGVVLSSAPTGQRWHVCEETSPGVYAWVRQGDGGGGDVYSHASSSVANQIAVFSGADGKAIQPATGSGVATLTDGVLGTVSGPADDCVKVNGSSAPCGSGGTNPEGSSFGFWMTSGHNATLTAVTSINASQTRYELVYNPETITVSKLSVRNGAGASGQTYAVGLYRTDCSLVVQTGVLSAATANLTQTVNVSPRTVPRGWYLLGWGGSNSSIQITGVAPGAAHAAVSNTTAAGAVFNSSSATYSDTTGMPGACVGLNKDFSGFAMPALVLHN